jgi:hypothetical protein
VIVEVDMPSAMTEDELTDTVDSEAEIAFVFELFALFESPNLLQDARVTRAKISASPFLNNANSAFIFQYPTDVLLFMICCRTPTYRHTKRIFL